MFCSKCGNQVPDNAAVCPSCGNQMNSVSVNFESKATVMANSPVAPDEPVMTAPMSQMPVYTAPVAPVPQKKNTGMVIGIVVVSIIAVAAIVFAILFATGTISFNKDENSSSVSDDENGDTTPVKEPEIGSISDLPVVTGDKSVEKVMLKIGFDGGVIDDGELKWLAFDYSDPTEHKAYLCMNMTIPEQIWIKKATMLITKDAMFQLYEGDSNSLTAKVLEFEEDDQNAVELYGAFFGFYNEDFLEECDFKYLGKESLKNTGMLMFMNAFPKKVKMPSKFGLMQIQAIGLKGKKTERLLWRFHK